MSLGLGSYTQASRPDGWIYCDWMHLVICIALSAPVNYREVINLAVTHVLRNCVKTSDWLYSIENKLVLANVCWTGALVALPITLNILVNRTIPDRFRWLNTSFVYGTWYISIRQAVALLALTTFKIISIQNIGSAVGIHHNVREAFVHSWDGF